MHGFDGVAPATWSLAFSAIPASSASKWAGSRWLPSCDVGAAAG
jgi:hypothetical protein